MGEKSICVIEPIYEGVGILSQSGPVQCDVVVVVKG